MMIDTIGKGIVNQPLLASFDGIAYMQKPVSYTHLTLPTKRIV